jgi:hypothetical protein
MTNLSGWRDSSRRPPVVGTSQPIARNVGQVELVDSGSPRPLAPPNDADILIAVSEVTKKIQQLSKNQQVLDAKLNYLTTRVAAIDANLINGFQYMDQCFYYFEALVCAGGDANSLRGYRVPQLPHWH